MTEEEHKIIRRNRGKGTWIRLDDFFEYQKVIQRVKKDSEDKGTETVIAKCPKCRKQFFHVHGKYQECGECSVPLDCGEEECNKVKETKNGQ